eukprot:SAG31_NODE_950_length_10811_cov_4.497760_4_plen_616_part_00
MGQTGFIAIIGLALSLAPVNHAGNHCQNVDESDSSCSEDPYGEALRRALSEEPRMPSPLLWMVDQLSREGGSEEEEADASLGTAPLETLDLDPSLLQDLDKTLDPSLLQDLASSTPNVTEFLKALAKQTPGLPEYWGREPIHVRYTPEQYWPRLGSNGQIADLLLPNRSADAHVDRLHEKLQLRMGRMEIVHSEKPELGAFDVALQLEPDPFAGSARLPYGLPASPTAGLAELVGLDNDLAGTAQSHTLRSLVLSAAHHYPVPAKLCLQIMEALQLPVTANMYVSAPGVSTAVHSDREDILILHFGPAPKRWILAPPPTFVAPFVEHMRGKFGERISWTAPAVGAMRAGTDAASITKHTKQAAQLDITLQPGDMLYVPRGHWHHVSAESTNSTAELATSHLTMNVGSTLFRLTCAQVVSCTVTRSTPSQLSIESKQEIIRRVEAAVMSNSLHAVKLRALAPVGFLDSDQARKTVLALVRHMLWPFWRRSVTTTDLNNRSDGIDMKADIDAATEETLDIFRNHTAKLCSAMAAAYHVAGELTVAMLALMYLIHACTFVFVQQCSYRWLLSARRRPSISGWPRAMGRRREDVRNCGSRATEQLQRQRSISVGLLART